MDKQTAIVTGAGQGIGRAVARRFAADGYSVAVAELDEATGKRVAQELQDEGHEALAIQTDVADETSVKRMVAATVREVGRPNVLVNNAGIAEFGDPLSMDYDAYRRNFQIDVDGMWFCCKYTLPHMLEAGTGAIVNLASTNGVQIIPHLFPYTIAKHAVVGLTTTLAVEYGPQGIRVNSLSPSYVETQAVIDYWATFDDPEAERERCGNLHPLGRNATTEDVANAALWLASSEASFITGVNLMIDGGRSVLYHSLPGWGEPA